MKPKETVSTVMAVTLVASGVTLSFLSFFLSNEGIVDGSVLWYFAQTLLYAGSVFGLKDYIDFRLGHGQK